LLDRDGVINFDSPDYITHVDDWRPFPDAIDAITKLQRVARVAVCTNQSAIGRGLCSESTLLEMHEKMNRLLLAAGGHAIDVYYCPHVPEDECPCRKPSPGLLVNAMRASRSAPSGTLFVGDSTRDLQAAASAGCVGVLVRTGNGEQTLTTKQGQACLSEGRVFASLAEFATLALDV
jgi:D-glycero-D-manno-heptose 1,7-bisphosphate phosphatase